MTLPPAETPSTARPRPVLTVPPVLSSPQLSRIVRYLAPSLSIGLLCGGVVFGFIGHAVPQSRWQATLLGQEVRYQIAAPNDLAFGREFSAIPKQLPCQIEINVDPGFMADYGSQAFFTYVSAHELGHCLDKKLLGNSHNNVSLNETDREGLAEKSTAEINTLQAETFADSYAGLYMRRCGLKLRPLGWTDRTSAAETPCALPDPRDVINPINPINEILILQHRALPGDMYDSSGNLLPLPSAGRSLHRPRSLQPGSLQPGSTQPPPAQPSVHPSEGSIR